MPKCSFCGDELKAGTGTLFVKSEGKLLYWCSNKCKVNAGMGRNPNRVNWTRKRAKETK